jgi:hypothetical protein
MSAYLEKIKKFIGKAQYDEFGGQQIWGVDSKDGMQPLADVRGWGAIQNMFSDIKEAEKFQDELGKFIAEAINGKLEGSLKPSQSRVDDLIRWQAKQERPSEILFSPTGIERSDYDRNHPFGDDTHYRRGKGNGEWISLKDIV